jgi:hypothetical protein
MANAAKHADPEFRRIGKAMRTAAHNNPNARCTVCQLTLTERRRTHPKATWDCGHPKPYRLECSHCNRSDGAKAGNASRHGNALRL